MVTAFVAKSMLRKNTPMSQDWSLTIPYRSAILASLHTIRAIFAKVPLGFF